MIAAVVDEHITACEKFDRSASADSAESIRTFTAIRWRLVSNGSPSSKTRSLGVLALTTLVRTFPARLRFHGTWRLKAICLIEVSD
nr:hypothetical protein [Chroococcidiopsis cubana]